MQQAHHDADTVYAAKRHLTRLLFLHGWRRKRIIVLFTVINWMMTLPELHQERYLQEIVELQKERNMELLNQWEQMCVDRGLKKGLEQGLEQGLERQLTRRFGPLPQAIQKKLVKASLAQLDVWSDAFVEATSLKQVFK